MSTFLLMLILNGQHSFINTDLGLSQTSSCVKKVSINRGGGLVPPKKTGEK